MKVSEITELKAEKFRLYAMFGNGRPYLAGKVDCAVLSPEGDNELSEIISERFNALQGLDRETVAELPKLIDEGTLALSKLKQLEAGQEKFLVSYGLIGVALTQLRDAVKAATPEGEALPQPLLDAMKQADELLAEIAKYDEQNETPPQS